MRKSNKLINKILFALEKVPNIERACLVVGIDRKTYYRWYHNDLKFKNKCDEVLELGRKSVNDAAEGVVISGIKNKELAAAKYWLSHNNPRYYPKTVEFQMNMLKNKQHDEPKGLTKEQEIKIANAMKKWHLGLKKRIKRIKEDEKKGIYGSKWLSTN